MTTEPAAWPLAAFLTSLPLPFAAAVGEVVALGFGHVDLVAEVERAGEDLTALADAGVVVGCAALGRGLPPGHALDAADLAVRRHTLDLLRRQVADAARLGATVAYVVPGTDATAPALARFAEGCALLADHAAGRMVRLCVEPSPGRALPDVTRTLAWLDEVGHAGLGLLLDVGHCLIAGEDPGQAARQAGPRLAHVHLDDNDGAGDLHWPLLTGRLTIEHLRDLAAALRSVDYRGGLALELNPATPSPTEALRASKEVVERFLIG